MKIRIEKLKKIISSGESISVEFKDSKENLNKVYMKAKRFNGACDLTY